MDSSSFLWCVLAAILLSNSVEATKNIPETRDNSRLDNEIILQRLDQLQFGVMKIYVHIKELEELVANNQRAIEQLQLQANLCSTMMVNYSKQILDLQTFCANHESIQKEPIEINPSLGDRSCQQESSKKEAIDSCAKINATTSGLFNMSISNFNEPVNVYCEMLKFGGGWLVIQNRFDGSVNFLRGWADYRDGFGTVGKEFWLGLEKVHQLTKNGLWELMIELETFKEEYSYARYSSFKIGSEKEKYSLNRIAGYSGTAGDQLSKQIGMKFSTLDNDNDLSNGNCAFSWKGAWWYKACAYSNLNGEFRNEVSASAIYWHGIIAGIKNSRMMIRRK